MLNPPQVLWFNAIENRSHEYGVSPWHWYFTSALPRSLLAGFAFIPLGALRWSTARSSQNCSLLRTIVPDGLDWAMLEYALPALAFVTLYSKLPHKELRFLLPALPLFHLLAGSGLAKVFTLARALAAPRRVPGDEETPTSETREVDASSKLRRRAVLAPVSPTPSYKTKTVSSPAAGVSLLQRIIGALLGLVVFVALVGSVLGTSIFVRVAMDNYPGGVGLQRLYSLQELTTCRSDVVAQGVAERWRVCLASSGSGCGAVHAEQRPLCTHSQWPRAVALHVDVAAAVSGVSRFAESWSGAWTVNKTEGMTDADAFSAAFDWLLTETPNMHAVGFEVVEAVPAFSRIDWRGGARVERAPALYIMRRRPMHQRR